MTLINSQNGQQLHNAGTNNLVKKFSVLAVFTVALAFQILQIPANAKTHEYTNSTGSNLVASNVAYVACSMFQSRNPSVGRLIRYRNLGSGFFGCDYYRGGCYRVTFDGKQAVLPVNGSPQMAKADTKTLLQITTN
jgi:hypothetical protein